MIGNGEFALVFVKFDMDMILDLDICKVVRCLVKMSLLVNHFPQGSLSVLFCSWNLSN